jgi:hypothetical protein
MNAKKLKAGTLIFLFETCSVMLPDSNSVRQGLKLAIHLNFILRLETDGALFLLHAFKGKVVPMLN